MKGFNSSWLLSILFTAAMIFTTACEDPNDTGLEVLPDEDLINGEYIDTFEVELKPILIDSVNTLNTDRSLLGNYFDPEFGNISADIYTQVRLVGSELQFGTNPANIRMDSIVLGLDLSGFYGRFDDPLQLQVFEITQEFPSTDTVWSTQSLNVDTGIDYGAGYKIDFSGLLGFKDFIEIRLDDSLGNKLLFADPDSLVNNSTFLSFFKGLALRTLPPDQSTSREPGGIFYIDLESTQSNLTLYYTDSIKPRTYTWVINSNANRFHHIERTDYQNLLLEQILMDTALAAAPYSAIQSGALIQTKVIIPGIKNLPKSGINRAEILLPLDPNFFGSQLRFAPPQQVLLFVLDSTGNKPLNPLVFNSSATVDPFRNQYVIPLTNTMMQILDGRLPDGGFIIAPANESTTLNRAIFAGEGHPTLKPKLKVVLTTLPE